MRVQVTLSEDSLPYHSLLIVSSDGGSACVALCDLFHKNIHSIYEDSTLVT